MSNIEKKVEELKIMLDNCEDFILLDVRTDNEVLISKISEKTVHIPMNEIPNRLNEINDEEGNDLLNSPYFGGGIQILGDWF